MSKKESAISFLKMASRGEVRAAYERYIAEDFIHHNQYFKGDRQSLMTAMEEAHKASPNKGLDVKRAIEEGAYVVTHSQVSRAKPGAAPIAVVHIFRFEGEKVAELWDLGQEISANSPNENGAF